MDIYGKASYSLSFFGLIDRFCFACLKVHSKLIYFLHIFELLLTPGHGWPRLRVHDHDPDHLPEAHLLARDFLLLFESPDVLGHDTSHYLWELRFVFMFLKYVSLHVRVNCSRKLPMYITEFHFPSALFLLCSMYYMLLVFVLELWFVLARASANGGNWPILLA